MIFETSDQAIDFIRNNQAVPDFILKARKQEKELSALITGESFAEELIQNIEHLETSAKATARAKYSRSIEDLFERLFQPISNVFNSHGGIKKYELKGEVLKKLLKAVGNIRDEKSIQSFLETYWMPQYHIDPNGIVFMEYKNGDDYPYPTIKSINSIRTYKSDCQNIEVILFEPIEDKTNGGKLWRLVDDKMDYTIHQNGESYTIMEDLTFEHPFGQVPGIINSDIVNLKTKLKESPIQKIVPIAKEYARDQSIKTLYKFLHGFPLHWRYVVQCKNCTGTGKDGKGSCPNCDGQGYYKRKDVTDMVTLPLPEEGSAKIAPDIAGYISPDLDTWDKYSKELETLEHNIIDTHWGTHVEEGENETATGRYIDVQPVINRLNKYSDAAQFMEWKITEFVANYIDSMKPKNKSIATIVYGRRFIIESPDSILKIYEEEKLKGANSVILDRLFEEYLTSKYVSDPEWLKNELLKSRVEPYLHLDISKVNEIFGVKEAQKKSFFNSWWSTLTPADLSKGEKDLRKKLEEDFNATLVNTDSDLDDDKKVKQTAQSQLRGSVGGATGLVAIAQAVNQNQMSEAAAEAMLIELYGFSEEVAKIIATKAKKKEKPDNSDSNDGSNSDSGDDGAKAN